MAIRLIEAIKALFASADATAKPAQRHGDLRAYGAKVRYTTDRTYDESKATAGYHRSRQQSATGRIYQTERLGKVLPMRRTK